MSGTLYDAFAALVQTLAGEIVRLENENARLQTELSGTPDGVIQHLGESFEEGVNDERGRVIAVLLKMKRTPRGDYFEGYNAALADALHKVRRGDKE